MKYILIALCSCLLTPLWSQVTDSFDDGDFTSNPTWSGNDADFIVNADNMLQTNATGAGESYLSTAHNLTQLADREWRFKIKYSFSPSANNGGDTYLTATNADLSTNPDGIFIHVGESGSADPIQLIERNGGVETTILSSTPGLVGSSFEFTVKIIYHANGDWDLYIDPTGNGAFQLNQTANYPATVLGQYFGVDLTYTSSNATNFYYDDFYVGTIEVDTIPPTISSVFALSTTQVQVNYDEAMDQTTGENVANYSINNGIGQPLSVQQNGTNLSQFTLTLSSPLTIGQTYQLTAANPEDLAGNALVTQSENFLYVTSQTPVYGDILINEFMADESPSMGLPETEYVELYNRSSKYFHLQNWKLSDNSSDGTIQDVWLYPGDYLLLVPSGHAGDFPNLTNVAEVTSWASLNNTGDEIHLKTDNNLVVDELTYTDDWYQDPSKEDGGWSIERINPTLPCSSSSNWRASVNTNGGTPGAQNSVYDPSPDTQAPSVTKAFAQLPNELTLTFSENMDSASLANATFSVSPTLTIASRFISSHFPNNVVLTFNESLVPGKVYHYTFSGFADCSGNTGTFNGTFVIPQQPEKGDLIINEILYNPPTGGSDFVEVYNHSDKYINMKDWGLANWDDSVSVPKMITENYILAPHDYVAITQDSSFQIQHFPFAVPGKFIQLSSLPSYNNDSSAVYLMYGDTVMDHVSYSDDWQFQLLSSTDGVSLERFSADLPSNVASSWHSASQAVNFGTPGRKNSEDIKPGQGGSSLSLSSKTLSPDGDGFEDAVLITYKVTKPNLLGSMIIYDDKGRKIKTLFPRRLLDAKETIQWDGTRDNGLKADIGPYIILFETFDVNGAETSRSKKVVTVAGRL